MKINKKELMTKAWIIAKGSYKVKKGLMTAKENISYGLKKAWEILKEELALRTKAEGTLRGFTVKVKRWIVEKNLQNGQFSIASACAFYGDVIAETEKAIKVLFNSDYGTISSWFPKSQIEKIKEN